MSNGLAALSRKDITPQSAV